MVGLVGSGPMIHRPMPCVAAQPSRSILQLRYCCGLVSPVFKTGNPWVLSFLMMEPPVVPFPIRAWMALFHSLWLMCHV